LQVQMMVNLN